MRLKFLDPDQTRTLLKDSADVLTPAVEAQEKMLHNTPCPTCGGHCRKAADPNTMWREGEMLPHFHLECLACGCEFDPRNGMIITLGNVGKAFVPAIPILGQNND